MQQPTPVIDQRPSSAPPASQPGDERAYFVPMAVFLLFTQVAAWWPAWLVPAYIVKTFLVAGLLVYFWKHYTKIRWDHWGLGVLVGVVGVVQWVGMEKLLLEFFPNYPRISAEPFNPYEKIGSPVLLYSFLAVRLLGATLLVPVMEELFWRDYLWRRMIAPNDFKLAEVGEWDFQAVAVVTLLFSMVHIQWLTAIVWGLLIAWLLIRTKSLGACIIAHGVTNFLLGVYVLVTKDWMFW